MFAKPKVLIVSSDETESNTLEEILREEAELSKVKDLSELPGDLTEGGHKAVFCGWCFPNGKWTDALETVQQSNPDLPVIIFFRAGAEREWVKVLEAGAFDLLVPPYVRLMVLAVLKQAVESCEARRQRNPMPVVQAS